MKCRICENEEGNREYQAREMLYGYRDSHAYFQCSRCGCLQIAEFPRDMRRYYDDTYYSHQPVIRKSIRKRAIARLRDRYAIFRTGLIGALLYSRYPTSQYDFLLPIKESLSPETRVLDVGCGSGNLLKALREAGFKRLAGIDPLIEADIRYKGDLEIKKQDIHRAEGSYDLIMFHHSFEHVSDPYETLRSAEALLAPEGHCLVRLPTVSSFAWRHYGVNWVQLDAPRHFYLHSIDSMKILAERAGLQVRDIIYDSTSFQFWGSEQYVRDIPLRDRRSYGMSRRDSILSEEDIAAFERRAQELNREGEGDQAAFYLTKPGPAVLP